MAIFYKISSFYTGLALLSNCVVSNLDNAFDPAQPTGWFLGQSLSGGGSSGSSATLSDTIEYSSAGNYSYTVPADARRVELIAIAGGGGGGEIDLDTDGTAAGGCGAYCSVHGEAGSASSISIQGGATLLSVTGGAGGTRSSGGNGIYAPPITGTGGAGGTPNGVTGESGNQLAINHIPAGGALSGYSAGKGGNGGEGGAVAGLDYYAGGAGGSGGMNATESTALAGLTLNLAVGAGGRAATTADGHLNPSETLATAGADGLAQIKIYK